MNLKRNKLQEMEELSEKIMGLAERLRNSVTEMRKMLDIEEASNASQYLFGENK
jgi:hypothetical protein